MKAKTENKKQKSKKSYVVLGVVFGALSLAGLGYWYFKGRKGVKVDEPEKDLFHNLNEDNVSNSTPQHHSPKTIAISSSGFPLKFGSKGALVKQLQEVLVQKYGASILPKYGADGYFGKELQTALKTKGYSDTVDMAEFTKIISSSTQPSSTDNAPEEPKIDALTIAKNIWSYAFNRKLSTLLTEMKKINNTEDYKAVNDIFKAMRLQGVRQTLVNGTLNSFDDDTSKQLIRNEFIRIGLKYNGSQWSLSGFRFKRHIASKYPTVIRNARGIELEVPENILLGEELQQLNGTSYFKTIDNEILNVPTNTIHYV